MGAFSSTVYHTCKAGLGLKGTQVCEKAGPEKGMYQHKMQHCYSKVYHEQDSAREYTSHDFRGRNKLVLGHEVADRNFLLEDIESAEFSLFSVVGSIGLMKAVRVGK